MYISQISAASPIGDPSAVTSLTFTQAIHVWIMHWKGEQEQHIAMRLGTNQLRVDAVLNERQHVGSRERAQNLLIS